MMTPRTIAVRAGFTLVETLVAISVLMIAIVGPYFIVQQSIDASYASRDQLIASSLAQEAAEYVYSVRDNDFLFKNADWLAGLEACRSDRGNANGCTIDPYHLPVATACGDANCTGRPLQLVDLGNGSYVYAQSGGTATRFTRYVKIDYTPTDPNPTKANQARVTVVVKWTSAQHQYTMTVTETLYKWL